MNYEEVLELQLQVSLLGRTRSRWRRWQKAQRWDHRIRRDPVEGGFLLQGQKPEAIREKLKVYRYEQSSGLRRWWLDTTQNLNKKKCLLEHYERHITLATAKASFTKEQREALQARAPLTLDLYMLNQKKKPPSLIPLSFTLPPAKSSWSLFGRVKLTFKGKQQMALDTLAEWLQESYTHYQADITKVYCANIHTPEARLQALKELRNQRNLDFQNKVKELGEQLKGTPAQKASFKKLCEDHATKKHWDTAIENWDKLLLNITAWAESTYTSELHTTTASMTPDKAAQGRKARENEFNDYRKELLRLFKGPHIESVGYTLKYYYEKWLITALPQAEVQQPLQPAEAEVPSPNAAAAEDVLPEPQLPQTASSPPPQVNPFAVVPSYRFFAPDPSAIHLGTSPNSQTPEAILQADYIHHTQLLEKISQQAQESLTLEVKIHCVQHTRDFAAFSKACEASYQAKRKTITDVYRTAALVLHSDKLTARFAAPPFHLDPPAISALTPTANEYFKLLMTTKEEQENKFECHFQALKNIYKNEKDRQLVADLDALEKQNQQINEYILLSLKNLTEALENQNQKLENNGRELEKLREESENQNKKLEKLGQDIVDNAKEHRSLLADNRRRLEQCEANIKQMLAQKTGKKFSGNQDPEASPSLPTAGR